MTALVLLLNGRPAGTLRQNRNGRAELNYLPEWTNARDAIPLSISLPLAVEQHDPRAVEPVLWGLLPDNEHTLQRWASSFQVSARNAMALLAHAGEDCAGAVQFVRPERLEEVLSGHADLKEPLDDAAIADRLRRLSRDSGASRKPDDVGQFSLAGAQPKTAFLLEDGRWYIPGGRIPTTHIIKPPTNEYDGYAENEHFCLNLAKRIGLPACESGIVRFEDQLAICVTRYDRLRVDGRLLRVHQEDFCQALGVMPQIKYQNQGGPEPSRMADLIREYSRRPAEDVETLFFALAFNWLIAGTDAHAKNYSLLLGTGGDVRLAPLYDLSSALPYRQLTRRKLKMAMKVGSRYRWWEIRGSDWETLAIAFSLSPEDAIARVRELALALPSLASSLASELAAQGLEHPVIARLVDAIADASVRCVAQLENS